jgi:hypothetical protein
MESGIKRINMTANEEVKNELIDIYTNLGTLCEVDWSKVRDMEFNEARLAKRAAIDKISNSYCLECPDFVEHVYLYQISI